MSLLSFGDTLPIIISTIEREWVYKRVLILIQQHTYKVWSANIGGVIRAIKK